MFDRPKSKAILKGVNMMLNGRYGEVTAVDLNSKTQRIDVRIQLNGENEEIDASIGHYEINDSNPEKPVIVLSDITVSRQWMQELASDNVEGKEIEIPQKLSGMVKLVL